MLRDEVLYRDAVALKTKSVLSLEKAAVRLFGPGGRLPGSSTIVPKTRASASFAFSGALRDGRVEHDRADAHRVVEQRFDHRGAPFEDAALVHGAFVGDLAFRG